jgi:hypothetical protein
LPNTFGESVEAAVGAQKIVYSGIRQVWFAPWTYLLRRDCHLLTLSLRLIESYN